MGVKFKEGVYREPEGGVRVLNRVVSSTKHGIECEADERYAEIIIRDLSSRE